MPFRWNSNKKSKSFREFIVVFKLALVFESFYSGFTRVSNSIVDFPKKENACQYTEILYSLIYSYCDNYYCGKCWVSEPNLAKI